MSKFSFTNAVTAVNIMVNENKLLDYWDTKYNSILDSYSFITLKWFSISISDVRFTASDGTPFGGSNQNLYCVMDVDGEFTNKGTVQSAQRIVDSSQARRVTPMSRKPLTRYWKFPNINRIRITTQDFKTAVSNATLSMSQFIATYTGANTARYPDEILFAHETSGLICHFKYTGKIGFELQGLAST